MSVSVGTSVRTLTLTERKAVDSEKMPTSPNSPSARWTSGRREAREAIVIADEMTAGSAEGRDDELNHAQLDIAPALDPRRPLWEDGYIAALSIHGMKSRAAVEAGICRATVMLRRRASPAFVQRELGAMELARDAVEDEIVRLAMEGQEQQTPTKGGIATRIERYPVLLLRLAEKMERGTWSQTQRVEHSTAQTYDTLADRKTKLEAVRAAIAAGPAVLELADAGTVEQASNEAPTGTETL